MAKKRNGFRKFSMKIEGRVENDNIHAQEGTGGWKYTRYAILVELGSCRISWRDYLGWFGSLSFEERLNAVSERKRLGIPVGFNDSLGRDQPMRIALEQTSEP